MRGRKPMMALGFLAVWLIGQMPGVLGFVVALHGSHQATVAQREGRVVVVFSHQPTESESEDNHDDHTVSFSVEENYVLRVTSTGSLLLRVAPMFAFHFLPAHAIGRDALAPTSLYPDHAPPSLAQRTAVLLV